MMTFSRSWQFSVTSKKDIYLECDKSNFIDCRINAYPECMNYGGIIRQSPNLVFIDLDISNFDQNQKRLDSALARTYKKIQGFGGSPTILWTGNGYHLYQPIKSLVLDQESVFSKQNFPNIFSISGKYSNWSVSELFLKFAEIFFTNNKADPQHSPKYNTCLIRIPNTHNSKCLSRGLSNEDSRVKIIQKWNGYRPPIQLLTKDYRRWLIQEELNQKIHSIRIFRLPTNKIFKSIISEINWIEKLIKTPLEDYRKFCIWRILCPYFVNVKKLPQSNLTSILEKWLESCNKLRKTDFNHYCLIQNNLRYVKSHLPPSIQNIRNNYGNFYNILKERCVIS